LSVPQQVVFSYVYQLPFGKGRKLDSSNRVLSSVISNWQFSGILGIKKAFRPGDL